MTTLRDFRDLALTMLAVDAIGAVFLLVLMHP